MGFPDFGKKNKGGKKDLPTAVTNKGAKAAKKHLKKKKPTQY